MSSSTFTGHAIFRDRVSNDLSTLFSSTFDRHVAVVTWQAEVIAMKGQGPDLENVLCTRGHGRDDGKSFAGPPNPSNTTVLLKKA